MGLPRHNVIVLTGGLTGSSVVAGLLGDAGYWTGTETAKKPDYDTFENSKLIAMNERLLKEAGYGAGHAKVFRREQIDEIAERLADIEPSPYRQFIQECDLHKPWLWKDPRLPLTVRFWARLLDGDRTRIILLGREHSQTWISHILRRQIETSRYCAEYYDSIYHSSMNFIENNNLHYIRMIFEDLLLEPEQQLKKLNDFLGTEISIADLHRVYRGRLYRRGHGIGDYLQANLIYLKNYRHRIGTS